MSMKRMGDRVKFGHYRVLQRDDGSLWKLGSGAMGVTCKALDTDLQCPSRSHSGASRAGTEIADSVRCWNFSALVRRLGERAGVSSKAWLLKMLRLLSHLR